MNYRVRRQGQELGTFSLDELRQRRATGEFTGNEYVMCEGKFSWQLLDLLLQHGPEAMPPPIPAPAKSGSVSHVVWIVVVIAAVCVSAVIGFIAYNTIKTVKSVTSLRTSSRQASDANSDAMQAAQKPVTWTTNTTTEVDANKRAREFRIRQWIQGYQEHGRHDQPWDADAKLMLQSWLVEYYGGTETNLPPAREMWEKLAKEPGFDDPLVLTIAALISPELHQKDALLERALKGFEKSPHRAYPAFNAAVVLAGDTTDHARLMELDGRAVKSFETAFRDGSFLPQDQPQIAEILLHGWGGNFFKRHQSELYPIVKDGGKEFAWLALVLEGEYHINEAWKARGSGYADSVTQQGWKIFSDELATARQNLTRAWELHKEWPIAADRMLTVSLGQNDITEMRIWFDRAVQAQFDYSHAWSDFRWGLRPRWFGSHEAMLALGTTAVNTGRFETDVPECFDSITEVESELNLPPGEHIYGRADVWIDMKRMYEGYIAAPGAETKGWRSTFAVIAYYANKYDVSRAQFEALHWDPTYANFTGWDRDFSLLMPEVAARTGPSAETVSRAEDKRSYGDIAGSLALYRELESATNADARTREFILHRVAALELEQRLQKGEWIDLQPRDDNDPNWVTLHGKSHVLPDGGLEVESGPEGHLLYSRVRVGPQFEVRGQFELVRSSTKDFQGGIVMGLPDWRGDYWNSFRVKHDETEGRIASFGYGWGTHQVARRAPVQDKTNSFDFQLQNFKGSATVNGTEVFRFVLQPHSLHVKNSEYMLGLGAFNDANDTVIRYHNVQVRRLTAAGQTTDSDQN